MPATSLSSTPVMGVLSASGTSPVFASPAGRFAIVRLLLSPLAFTGSTAALLKSTDGGSTWTSSPVAIAASNPAATVVIDDAVSALYQISVTLSQGSVLYSAYDEAVVQDYFAFSHSNVNIIEPGGAINPAILSMTTTQLLELHQLRAVPLTAAAIAPPLKMYKQLAGGVIATLSVPSGAQTAFWGQDGTSRGIRASTVQVSSLVDQNGNAVSSATSIINPNTNVFPFSTTYTVGGTVNAQDLGENGYLNTFVPGTSTHVPITPASGPFSSYETNWTGIYGFTTLLEAACYCLFDAAEASQAINLSALGL